MPESKLETNPWLRRLYAGYAFSLDYREARDWFGLRFRPVDTKNARAWLGANTRNDAGRLVVSQVRRETPAHGAGFNVEMRPGVGPVVDWLIREAKDVERLQRYDPRVAMDYIMAQIRLLTQRLDVPVISGAYGADPASVAHDGVVAAQARGAQRSPHRHPVEPPSLDPASSRGRPQARRSSDWRARRGRKSHRPPAARPVGQDDAP